MQLEIIQYDMALHPSYFRQSITRERINVFRANLQRLFERLNEAESEEHNKNIIAQFLRDTYYSNEYELNTAGRKDLVIHQTNTSLSPVAVIIETKSPHNKTEMISLEKPNTKALHEAIHYFLQERMENQNNAIKHLIITNIKEWFIFDAAVFEQCFYADKTFRNQYQAWHDKKLLGTTTEWFYNEIAKPFVEQHIAKMPCLRIYLPDYEVIVKEEGIENDRKLINLYKAFSPEHLLKLPFANDYNKIDIGFYNELLYILGLEEVSEGGLQLIKRIKPKHRKEGSLLENTISFFETKRQGTEATQQATGYPQSPDELFEVALELVITWLNRMLFLKLLEAQLVQFHRGNTHYLFLNYEKINDYSELDELFFEVMAIPIDQRSASVRAKFGHLPYLNSSLFEPTAFENKYLFISCLKKRLTLPLHPQSVLKQTEKFRHITQLNTLEYVFEFLNAYNFASDSKAEIQDDNRTIINSAVLGLIFEKINGYKDGSFYTPSSITTFISREVLQATIVQKFSKALHKDIPTFEALKDIIDFSDKAQRQKANDIINSIKICDPAVGSGHFLVAALNELIALKSELKILQYTNGNRLKGIVISNYNDELAIIDTETNTPFRYYLNAKQQPIPDLQEVQEALFHEKRTLIEKCLFGVDINPKSVLICRLRLWIELLKSAYYKPTPQAGVLTLETLPNIDINIVAGNSLISKFDKKLDIFEKKAVKDLVYIYKTNATNYQNETDYRRKAESKRTITYAKQELLKFAKPQDKYYRLFIAKSRELGNLLVIQPQSEPIRKQIARLSEEVAELEQKYKENYSHVYKNSIEWALEFPAILNEDGEFIGFDIVMGNPPYFAISREPKLKEVNESYEIFKNTADIYTLFIERGLQILREEGRLGFITSNKWLRAAYGEALREYLLKHTTIEKIVDFGGVKVFDEATVDTNILQLLKRPNEHKAVPAVCLDKSFDVAKDSIGTYFDQRAILLQNLDKGIWHFASAKAKTIQEKVAKLGTPLAQWHLKINFGIKTGYNEAFIIDSQTREALLAADSQNANLIKPILRGRDVRQYYATFKNLYLIHTSNGYIDKITDEQKHITKHSDKNYTYQNAEGLVKKAFRIEQSPQTAEHKKSKLFRINRIVAEQDYPTIYQYLQKFENQLIKREDKGNHWTNLRNCAYENDFSKEKIIYSEIVQSPQFYLDTEGYIPEATCFFMVGENLKYLVAMLNSKLLSWVFKNFYAGGGLGAEGFRYKKAFVEQLPIILLTSANQPIATQIESFVNTILAKKRADFQADISPETDAIDTLIYQLYALNAEEIALIEQYTN